MLETKSRETTSEEHGDTLDYRAPVKSPAATDSVKGEDADKSSHLVQISIMSMRYFNLRGIPYM